MSVHIVAIKSFGPKERDDVRAVGGHGAIGMSGFGMALLPGHAFVRRVLPKNPARALVKAKDFPLLNLIVLRRSGFAVEPHLKQGGLALVDRGGDKQTVSPNNGAGV